MKTTKKDFELFKSECEKWISFFGITEYSINYYHEKSEKQGLAFSRINATDYWASVKLNVEWGNFPISDNEVKKCAFHEICHIMLERLVHCGMCRFVSEEEVVSALESVIKRMENTVFKQLNNKKK